MWQSLFYLKTDQNDKYTINEKRLNVIILNIYSKIFFSLMFIINVKQSCQHQVEKGEIVKYKLLEKKNPM